MHTYIQNCPLVIEYGYCTTIIKTYLILLRSNLSFYQSHSLLYMHESHIHRLQKPIIDLKHFQMFTICINNIVSHHWVGYPFKLQPSCSSPNSNLTILGMLMYDFFFLFFLSWRKTVHWIRPKSLNIKCNNPKRRVLRFLMISCYIRVFLLVENFNES